MEIANGNQADKARFAGLQEFREQWTFKGLCVADGALSSADNLKAMAGLKWLTRVPLSIKQAAALVDEKTQLPKSQLKGYTIAESSSEYGEVSQRWLLIDSEPRRKSDLEKLEKKIEQKQKTCQQELQVLSKIRFCLCRRCASGSTETVSKNGMASTLRH